MKVQVNATCLLSSRDACLGHNKASPSCNSQDYVLGLMVGGGMQGTFPLLTITWKQCDLVFHQLFLNMLPDCGM